MTDSTWHYQLMRHKTEWGETCLAVHEYCPIESGDAWTEAPVFIDVNCKSVEEVKNVMMMMLEDIQKHGVKDYE